MSGLSPTFARRPSGRTQSKKIKDRPEGRIAYVLMGVESCRGEVEKWKREHDELAARLWAWEDVVEKIERLYVRILDLDDDIQGRVFRGEQPFDGIFADQLAAIMPNWLDLARSASEAVSELEAEYGSVRGVEELRSKMHQAEMMTIPDSKVFGGPKLARLQAEAIQEHRAGLTEPMQLDACR